MMELVKSLQRLGVKVMASPVRSAVKAYVVFAIVHTLFKIRKQARLVSRAHSMLGHLPGAKFSLGKFDWLGLGTLKNVLRYFDYRAECQLEHKADGPLIAAPGPFVEVFCNDRASIKHLLKDDFNSFTKGSPGNDYLMEIFKDFLGTKGIFVIQHGSGLGDKRLENAHDVWHKQRKIGSKIFTKSSFSSLMLETFNAKAHVLKNTILSRQGTAIDMQECFFRFTFDSINKIFFGRDIDTVSGAHTDDYAKAYDNSHRAMTELYLSWLPVHVAAQMYLPFPLGTSGQDSSGWSLAMELVRRFTPEGRDFKYWCNKLDQGTYNLIKEARADPKLPHRRDLLANFINSKGGYTDQELRDIVLNFIIAGRDTTACTLSWLHFQLSCHPEVQSKARAEANKVLGGREPTYELVKEMHYLHACVFEALRINPPVPEDYKIASQDSQFPDGTWVPKGTKVTFHNYSLGRSSEIYDEPELYKPARWLNAEGKLMLKNNELDPYLTPIFQAGPRECLGKNMAILEVVSLTSILLSDQASGPGLEFSITEEEKKTITWAMMITQAISNNKERSSHNLWLTARPVTVAEETN